MYTLDSGAILYYLRINRSFLLCSTESVSLRDIGKPTSRAEISSPSSLHLRAVKRAHIGSALFPSLRFSLYSSGDVPLLNHFMAEIAFVIICITPPPQTQIQSQLCDHMTYIRTIPQICHDGMLYCWWGEASYNQKDPKNQSRELLHRSLKNSAFHFTQLGRDISSCGSP